MMFKRPYLVWLLPAPLIAMWCLCGFQQAEGEESVPEKVRTLAVLNFVNRDPGDGWDRRESGRSWR